TMEMWELGFHMDRLKLALFMAVVVAVVIGLSRFAGFRAPADFAEDLLDALAALLMGLLVATALLWLMALITDRTSFREALGMVAVQAAPASMGAVLANKQLTRHAADEARVEKAGYLGQFFLMAAGALFFAFNVAPTEEMILIGFKM